MRGFGSDNHAPVYPSIMEALLKVNKEHEPSYGTDSITEACKNIFKQNFGPSSESFFVFNGTAANILSLRALIRPHESCLVTDISHLNTDECGAPEAFSGKLIPVLSRNGKFIFEELEKKLIRLGDQHYSQPKAISITQPTEYGTVYSYEELEKIISWAKKHHLYVHIDGARFTNALYFLNTTFQEFCTKLDIDIISFGGTKNGLMFGETIIILNKCLQKDFKYIRKHLAQLPSKTRYLGAQFLAYLNENTHFKIAQNSCDMATYLKEQIETHCRDFTITQPVESNVVFCKIPKKYIKPLKQKYFFYVWDEHTFECRLMTSWDTQKEDIDGFIKAYKDLP
ncbi:MAG: threonine aldolase family protein [Pseudobdellovibrio sp.]